MVRGRNIVFCGDCGAEYNAWSLSVCPVCQEMEWCIWDTEEYHQPAPSEERGIYERGFASKAAAEAAILRIQAEMAALGHDLSRADFWIAPRFP